MQPIRRKARPALLIAMAALAFAQPVAHAAPPDPAPGARALMREEKYAEAAAEFQTYLKGNPYDGAAWGDLGYSLHAVKRYDEAIPAYAKAIELGSRPETQMYNTACAHALCGRTDEAITWLKKSLENRFAEQQTLERDTDMDSLRTDARFIALTGLNPPPEPDRAKQWAWDLDFMVRRMEQMHWDLYGRVSKEAFNREVQALKADVPGLSDAQVQVRLTKIIAMVGDGHTGVAAAPVGQAEIPRYPVHLFLFADGLHVLGAPEEHANLVGAKVLRVGSLETDAAIAAVKPYISVDNAMGYAAVAPGRLVNPAILQAIAAAAPSEDSGCEFMFRLSDGKESKVRLTPKDMPAGGHGGSMFVPGYKYVHDAQATPPLYLREPGKRLWTQFVPEHRLLYARFGGVQNTPGLALADFAAQITEQLQSNDAERLVLDMRFNGGGNTGLLPPLLLALIKSDRINQPGRLFVIIGRHTFSAAQNGVNMLEDTTNATFVGEPTGSSPAFIGESTFVLLPYSKVRVHCSSRYWQWGDSTDRRTWVQPQIAAPPTFAAYAAGHDDAMDAIVARLSSDGSANR